MMKKFSLVAVVLLICTSFSFAAQKDGKQQTFVGFISDSMCGLKHMSDDAKKCTVGCINMGSQYVLADTEHNKVYKLSDQEKPKAFAAEKVKVTGTLDDDTIKVASIVAAN